MSTRGSPHANSDPANGQTARWAWLARPWMVLWVGGAGYAWLMGSSRPFTVGADAETAVAFAGVLGAAVVVGRRWRRAGEAGSAGAGEAGHWWVWLAVLCVVVGWELFCYFSGFGGHRHAYPTISSLQNVISRSQAGRAAMVLAWMALGWRIARR